MGARRRWRVPPDPPLHPLPEGRTSSYLLAVADTGFLLRDELRGVRFQLEYEKAELLLRDWGIRSTVIVFGSARVPSPEVAAARRVVAETPEEVAIADRMVRQSAWYQHARDLGRIVSQRGGAFAPHHRWRDNVIATGGGPGVMEAANRGAADAGAPSIGLTISLPEEEHPNRYSTPELTFRFHYFAMRKMHLAMRANALVVFPGGFGTLDELFEILTLVQTRKAPAAPIVLFGASYWKKLVNFDFMVEEHMIAREDLDLFAFADTAEEAWAELVRMGLHAHTPDGR